MGHHQTVAAAVALHQADIATLAIHADSHLAVTADMAPAINVTSTYKLPEKAGVDNYGSATHVYTRESSPIRSRVEAVLGKIHDGGHAVTYATGLAAMFALLLHLKPRRIVFCAGYHGCHAVLDLYRKKVAPLEEVSLSTPLTKEDLVWIENPTGPTGEVYDTRHYADHAHTYGARLVVDATMAPPPLQQPFRQGADFIVHSAAKYLSGHSDVMGGVIITRCCQDAEQLKVHRTVMGAIMGSLESWLLLRSLRTLSVRVMAQSRTTAQLVAWLNMATRGCPHDGLPANVVAKVFHGSLQSLPKGFDVCTSFPHGFGAVFTVQLSSEAHARRLSHQFSILDAATSFGSYRSTIEWRHAIDPKQPPATLRVAVGLESIEDLKRDWRRALNAVCTVEIKISAKL
ncbi:hypothetical protein H4R35_000053 [Dimargaris xerosporica]|nr:hypothetical protein H4R35_000053 [Dimargaris xerosporica]